MSILHTWNSKDYYLFYGKILAVYWPNFENCPALNKETLHRSNLNMTKRYLGVRQDEINNLYETLNL